MSPKSQKPTLQTIALSILCIGLTIVIVVLLAKIVEIARALPANGNGLGHANGNHHGITVVTPTPQPMTPTPTETLTPTPTQTPTSTPLPTRTPTPTATPTETPTPTITPTPLPLTRPTAVSVVLTPTEEVSGTHPIPTAVPRYPISEDAMVIALLGSDRRPDWEHWNTDAIQYLVVYPKVPSVALLSIPRDLYVYIPTHKMNRINVADMYGERYGFDGGGFGLLNQTLLYNLGITADYYAKVNFQGLKGIVDALGGIDVPVHCHLEDWWPYPNEEGEYNRMVLEPGVHHMDGKLALWYSRTRKTTSVFDREERQQQVLEAIWLKARQEGYLDMLPEIYQQYGTLVETNLGWTNMLSLGVLATHIHPSQVTFYNLGPHEVTPYVTIHGGNVFLPNWEAIAPVIERALLPPAPSRAARTAVRVEVWNGTGHPQWDQLAADRLYQSGFTPVLGRGNGQFFATTQIQVFADHAKGTGVSTVQAIFGISDGAVSFVGTGGSDAKLRLIMGADYQVCP